MFGRGKLVAPVAPLSLSAASVPGSGSAPSWTRFRREIKTLIPTLGPRGSFSVESPFLIEASPQSKWPPRRQPSAVATPDVWSNLVHIFTFAGSSSEVRHGWSTDCAAGARTGPGQQKLRNCATASSIPVTRFSSSVPTESSSRRTL